MPKKPVDGFYYSKEWKAIRKLVLEMHSYTCANCGIVNDEKMAVDHIRPRKQWPSLALSVHNLRVLCRKCHAAAGTSLGRGGDHTIKKHISPGVNVDGLPEGWE